MRNSYLTCACLFVGFTLLCQARAAVVPAGPQISIYGGASYSSGVPGSLTVIPVNYLGYEVDTHVGNTSGPDFTPGIGIAYDFLTTAADQNNNFIHDFSVGLDLFHFNTNLTGTVYLYGESSLNYDDYKLNFNSTWLMLDGQVNFHPIAKVTPFILAGLDVARVASSYSSFTNSQAPSYLAGTSLFLPGRTNYNAAYSLGAGVKVPLWKRVEISARYLFTDFGTVETGGDTILSNGSFVDAIKTRIHTQAWLVGLTYTC